MRILKGLYVCWILFWVVAWLISPMIAHNPNRIAEFFKMLGLIAFPAMVASLVLFAIKRVKAHLIWFLVLLLCYPLGLILFFVVDWFART